MSMISKAFAPDSIPRKDSTNSPRMPGPAGPSGNRTSTDLVEAAMGKTGIAKLFRNGRSQAVRLPQEFRFEGDQVRIRRLAHGVLLEPLIPDAAKWFDEMDRFNQEQFMVKRRSKP